MLAELRERLQGLGYQFAIPEADGEAAEASEAARLEEVALRVALRRALAYTQNICGLPEPGLGVSVEWPDAWPTVLREPTLDLAAAYFLQARLALCPDELAVMPVLTSLRLGDAALGFAGGSQKTGTDALSRAEGLCNYLLRTAQSAFCGWRGILW